MASISFLNDRSELKKLPDFIYGVFESCGVPRKDYVKLRSGLDEALTNCILYAYDTPGQTIYLDTLFRDGKLYLTITDSGKPFDPVAYVSCAPTSGDDLQIGGLGIVMIKNIFDTVTYRRDNDKNILELTIQL